MNKDKVSEIVELFKDEHQIKSFQVFCAKRFDAILNTATMQRWAARKANPNAASRGFLMKWMETNAR